MLRAVGYGVVRRSRGSAAEARYGGRRHGTSLKGSNDDQAADKSASRHGRILRSGAARPTPGGRRTARRAWGTEAVWLVRGTGHGGNQWLAGGHRLPAGEALGGAGGAV